MIAQNVFRASLNSFIAKVARNSNVGANYSRVYTLEVVGGHCCVRPHNLPELWQGPRSLLHGNVCGHVRIPPADRLHSLQVWTQGLRGGIEGIHKDKVFRKSEKPQEEVRLRRPPSLTAKAIMSVTLYGFSYFYVLQAERMDIPPLRLSVLFLLLSYVLGIPWARLGGTLH